MYDDLIAQGIDQAYELLNLKHYANCRLLLEQGIKTFPAFDGFVGLLGMLEAQLGNHQKALDRFEEALALNPTTTAKEAWHFNNRALSKEALGQKEEAVADYRKAIELNPNYAPAYSNLANALKKQGQTKEALDLLDQALSFDDKAAYAWFNKGTLIAEQGRVEEGLACQKRAFELEPDCDQYGFNVACSLMLSGDWQEGWRLMEHRHGVFLEHKLKRNAFLKAGAEWKGEDLNGKRVYLYCTQGDGDRLQFVRFAKLLKDRGATVILETPDNLRGIFSRLSFVDEFVTPQNTYIVNEEPGKPKQTVGYKLEPLTLPTFDYHAELFSLPTLLGITPDNVPSEPYLEAAERVDLGDGFKVGIVWAGSPIHINDPNRSCYLREFDGLWQRPVKLFSFQQRKDPRVWPGIGVVDLMEGRDLSGAIDLADRLNTFDDSANYLAGLDLLVTVDTAIAHLAGAMGKRVFIALPFMPDWRWGLGSSETPWYPSVKLFRQERPKEWGPVFENIVEEVKRLIESPR